MLHSFGTGKGWKRGSLFVSYSQVSDLAGHFCNGATHRILPRTNIAHCPNPVPGGVPFQDNKNSDFTDIIQPRSLMFFAALDSEPDFSI